MGRILAIDYGRKRCGIAVTDPLKIIANGLHGAHSSAHGLLEGLHEPRGGGAHCHGHAHPAQRRAQREHALRHAFP